MSREFNTKAELAKSGTKNALVIIGIVLYFIYAPLSILAGILFIYWSLASYRENKQLEKRGEVYIGREVKLLDLEKTNTESNPFASVIDVETTGLLVDKTIPTISKVNENPDWYPNIVQIA